MGIIIDLSLDYIIILGLFIGLGDGLTGLLQINVKKNYAVAPILIVLIRYYSGGKK